MSRTLGINLGSNVTTVYEAGNGIVVREPNAVAVDTYTQETLAIGQEAINIYNKTPGAVDLITHIYQGNVSDYERMAMIVELAINKTGIRRPEIIFACHGGQSRADISAIVEMFSDAGAKTVKCVDLPTVCVMGSGASLNNGKELLVCDIGAANAEIGIVKGCVTKFSRTLQYGCNKLDQAIMAYVKNEYNAAITERMACTIRETIGSVHPSYNIGNYDFVGVDLITGLPCDLTINSSQTVEIMQPFAVYLIANIAAILKKLPETILRNVKERGILLTGGGALDGGIKTLIEENLEIPVQICTNSTECAIEGLGMIIENRKIFDVLLRDPIPDYND
ncbi:MAG: rod shape-determining protein [Clostridia bacterium]|nr:rod shape-determining protein [Clostridia bacterium]